MAAVCRHFSVVYYLLTNILQSSMYSYVTFRLFREKCSADRSWKFVLVGPEKSWKSHGK